MRVKALRASLNQQPPGKSKRRVKRLLGGIASTAVVASSLVFGGATVAQANQSTVTPAPNPGMTDSCEINLAITLDYSNSMSANQIAEQEDAVKDLATALQDYPVSLALFNFGSNSPTMQGPANEPLPLTSVSTQAGIDAIHAKLDAFGRSGVNYTNWQAAFDTVRTSGESYDALALVTDGNPTRITHPSVVQNTSDNPVNQAIVDGGVTAANQLKADGTRIIGVAVTDNLNTNAYNAMLRQIPQVTGPTEGSDYHLGGLSGLQQTLLDIVNENCAIINLDKVGTLSADGNTIDYDFTVRNDGVVTLSNVDIDDPMPGLSAVSWGTWPGEPFVLEPGEEVTATATYTVTAEDRESGNVHNLATALGTPPSGGTPVEDEDPADVSFVPSISLTKTADPQTYSAVGDEITYTFLVENDGDVALTAVDVNDELVGLTDITFSNWPGAPNTLLPGETVTGTATLAITQAHIDAGQIINTAITTGTPPTLPGGEIPDPVTDTDDATVTGPSLDPALTLEKEADVDTYEAGDEITYTFTIANTGNTTLSGVTVNDPLAGLSALTYTWPAGNTAGVLEPGQTGTATATYTATQADVDRGFVHNAATATGTPPVGPDPENPLEPPVTPPAEENVEGPDHDPSISLVKTATLSADENTVAYTFTAMNTGNVTLTDVVINDPMTGLSAIVYDWSGATAEGTLAPSEVVTGTASYTVTQADRNAGSIVNLADTQGTPPDLIDPENPEGPGIPQEPVADEDPALVNLAQSTAINLVKTGVLVGSATAQAGDLVSYTFTITNTGNVVLTDVEVTDAMLDDAGVSITIADTAWPGAVGVLNPGQSVEGSASYPLTQDDIDAGQVDNVAIATGVSPIADPDNPGETIRPSDEDDVTVEIEAEPGLALTKSADVAEFDLGDTITYTFTATNTGNVTLDGVEIDDPLAGLSALTYDWSEATANGVLAPGDVVTATATYVATQADVDRGIVHNAATATGVTPGTPGEPGEPDVPGEPVTTPPAEEDVEGPEHDPSITLVKTGVLNSDADATVGDLVAYTFVATNTGNVTLTGVTITDPLVGLSAINYDWSEATAAGTLAPGERVTGTATYSLTQADIDAGHVDNTATTQGTPPNIEDPEDPEGPGIPQEPVTDEDEEIVTVPVNPSIMLAKTGALEGQAEAGETITYSFVATNTGNVTLAGVTITDPLVGLSAISYNWALATADGVLAPGEQVTATATYQVTQADIDAGSVVNLATTHGTPPNVYDPETPDGPGIPQEPVTDEDPEIVDLPQGAAIQLVKTGELAGDAAVGDLVAYTFVATNIGNVTLTGVTITDPLVGLSAINYDWTEATAAGTLAPGERVTGTATYPLTQADIDAGHVDNIATAEGTPPSLEDPEDPEGPGVPQEPVTDEDEEIIIVPTDPAIALVKTSELLGDAVAGDDVEFTFVATNTGNVTLTAVTVTDPLPGLSALSIEWPAADAVLEPGQSATATASYTLTQADVDAGDVINTATAEGTPPNAYDPEDPNGPGTPQDPVIDEDTVITPLPQDPAIELVKTGAIQGEGLAGDKVNYTFVATNIGNVTLSGVTITDPLPGLSALVYDWSDATAEGVLAPGESVSATASYTLTEADIRSGKLDNTADVIGYAPLGDDPVGGEPVTDEDTVTVRTGALPVTGGELTLITLLGGGSLLLAGAFLMAISRKRKQVA